MTSSKALVLDAFDKMLLVLIGLIMCFGAVVLFEQWATGEGLQLFMPWMWPYLFGAAGLSCFNFAVNPTCRVAYSLSGSLTAGAFFARAMQFTYLMFDTKDPLPWEHTLLDVSAYFTAMLLVILCWRRLIRRAPHDPAGNEGARCR